MMSVPVLIVSIVAIASVAWVAWARHRHAPNIEALLSRLHNPVTGGPLFFPALPSSAEQRALDDLMWRSVNGRRGIFRMLQNAGTLLTLSIRMTQENDTEQNERNVRACARLRISLLLTFLESLLLPLVPSFPRFAARKAIELYLELCSEVRAMIEYQHPCLIDQFDKFM